MRSIRVDEKLKASIYERVQMLIEGNVDDPCSEKPLSKEALTAKLTDLIYTANDLHFRMGVVLNDLDIERQGSSPVVDAFEWAMDDLRIPTI